jgi:hypothetical protein
MSKIRVSAFAVSLDGYAAGPHQSLDNPLGVRGPELFEWFFSTRTWKQMHGEEGGSIGHTVDSHKVDLVVSDHLLAGKRVRTDVPLSQR